MRSGIAHEANLFCVHLFGTIHFFKVFPPLLSLVSPSILFSITSSRSCEQNKWLNLVHFVCLFFVEVGSQRSQRLFLKTQNRYFKVSKVTKYLSSKLSVHKELTYSLHTNVTVVVKDSEFSLKKPLLLCWEQISRERALWWKTMGSRQKFFITKHFFETFGLF